jgi:histidinol dehydrogenase
MSLPINEFNLKSFRKQQKQSVTSNVLERIEAIRNDVLQNGDEAIKNYCKLFDGVTDPDFSLIATAQEIDAAYSLVSKEFIQAIKEAIKNIRNFHSYQQPKNWQANSDQGYNYGMQFSAITSVGLYVPGGRALYPSTVLMNAIPAKLAGVQQIIMTSPPQKNGMLAPEIYVAAKECNVDIIVKVGGAQAIFALAYGSYSVPKVDKIVGPGNVYVDEAKKRVYGEVDIDKPAGPSEVLIYIEDKRYAAYAASELLAQLEHDPNAQAQAISSNKETLTAIQQEFDKQLPNLKRTDIITDSKKNCFLFLVHNEENAIQVINDIASEHLVLCVDNHKEIRAKIKHAGAIFCGPYTPVALGDYIAGPNHVLPTAGAARFSSALSVMDFMKFSSFLECSKQDLKEFEANLKILTDVEQLDAHFNSVRIRLK